MGSICTTVRLCLAVLGHLLTARTQLVSLGVFSGRYDGRTIGKGNGQENKSGVLSDRRGGSTLLWCLEVGKAVLGSQNEEEQTGI